MAQAASYVMGGKWALPVESAARAHLRFWDLFAGAEMKFFGEGVEDKKKKTLVSFKDYIKDQEKTVRRIYKNMGVEISEDFERALKDDAERHANYKAKRGYDNPDLEKDLGVKAKDVEDRMKEYIKKFKL
ncbi:hypothetical protein TL16_g11143 [Triparma laevis f. inornata]|uniref:Uncharacterized protein n=1 Tax=Triparma laevis f. inornata TaxID=1714386 RepID=A0A9W7ESM2_9STRA|nr:hypothetical protein TL16_g11143 [Triparma laevis f. inornata]